MTSAIRRSALGLPLSRREMSVLRGLSYGFSNREIGAKLHLTASTVKTHARHLYQKLGARDRAHAVRLGFEAGYLKADAARRAVAS